MPRQCTICTHDQRPAIDEALLLNVPASRIAADHDGLTEASVKRHRENHLSEALAGALVDRQTRAEEGPRAVLDRLEQLADVVEQLLEGAKSEGRTTTALSAVRELRNLLETVAKITGELNDRPQVAVFQLSASTEWAQVREALFAALAGHPAARVDVATALAALPEAGQSS